MAGVPWRIRLSISAARAGSATVIPGRAEGANPESITPALGLWIPDSRCAASGMTSRAPRLSPEPGTRETHDGPVERGQKTRPVARRERFWAAGDLAGTAQAIHQVACRQRHADRFFGKGL